MMTQGAPENQADFASTAQSDVVAKLIYYSETSVAPMRVVHLADETLTLNMGVGLPWLFHGSRNIRRFGSRQRGCPQDLGLQFNGMVVLKGMTPNSTLNSLMEEISSIFADNLQAARAKVRSQESAHAKQSSASKAKAKSSASGPHARWSDEDWAGWRRAGYHWRSAIEWCRYWSCQ